MGSWSATRRSACPVLRHSESGPLGLSVRKCGATGSASGQTACPVRPTLRQSQSRHGNAATWQRESFPPRCPSPPLLPVWMNVYFVFPWCWTPLPLDFLSVLVVRGGIVCLPTSPSWFSNLFRELLIQVSITLQSSTSHWLRNFEQMNTSLIDKQVHLH